jgi:serine/threonine protein kinase
MGMVYRAEPSAPVQRRVALKSIEPGMDTRRVLARFQAERQALALMSHAVIARVFDSGSPSDARPQLAMELVSCLPINAFCRRHSLPTWTRLELFAGLSDAVQHAHQKGVIHCDLKPSNILVLHQNGDLRPKINDFVVARATRPTDGHTLQALLTMPGELIGTFHHMSPEQADGSVADVDSRADVYSLGLVLYEHLTGQLPFGSKVLAITPLREAPRQWREYEPARPSTRITENTPSRCHCLRRRSRRSTRSSSGSRIPRRSGSARATRSRSSDRTRTVTAVRPGSAAIATGSRAGPTHRARRNTPMAVSRRCRSPRRGRDRGARPANRPATRGG